MTEATAPAIRAVLTPVASAAIRRDAILEATGDYSHDLFSTVDPVTVDFSDSLDAALQAEVPLLVSSGAPVNDARLADATGANLILVGNNEDDLEHILILNDRLERMGYSVAGYILLEPAGGEFEMTFDQAAQLERREQKIGPELFERNLIDKARAQQAHIVLPEGDDDRILEAAHLLLEDEVCKLTILGDPEAIKARAEELGLDISGAGVEDPTAGDRLEQFAEDFAELRKHKGTTVDEARETMKDISYYATMMVHQGLADGMVSGAAHTTAHTIKPSFQIIKTAPGSSVVSSIFLMVMDGVLWAFGDCAVNPDPTPEQLAEIAAVSAQTAQQFGIEPKVAMLSYSTGTSGAGEDVEAVAKATQIAKDNNPDLAVDGPLQFDAAVVESVGQKKMPGSDVAGKATVFVFPDLNTGNITYKAVQRTAEALAVGPILQGLNKPVNDLSRGATVPDIVNTVAITAIQASTN